MELYHGDCLDIMKRIPEGSVDMVCVDPPYGTTECKWDSIIEMDLMWKELTRIVKINGAIVMFSAQPFTSKLISSNYNMFKQELIWEKNVPVGFFNANKMHLLKHENICLFYQKLPTYNKQFGKGTPYVHNGTQNVKTVVYSSETKKTPVNNDGKRFPVSVLKFARPPNNQRCHPSEKPIDLLKYLIKTFTNEGETVLDFTMGSGSTGVSAKETKRQFIGIEKSREYFNVAKKRISMTVADWEVYIKMHNKSKSAKNKKRKVDEHENK